MFWFANPPPQQDEEVQCLPYIHQIIWCYFLKLFFLNVIYSISNDIVLLILWILFPVFWRISGLKLLVFFVVEWLSISSQNYHDGRLCIIFSSPFCLNLLYLIWINFSIFEFYFIHFFINVIYILLWTVRFRWNMFNYMKIVNSMYILFWCC